MQHFVLHRQFFNGHILRQDLYILNIMLILNSFSYLAPAVMAAIGPDRNVTHMANQAANHALGPEMSGHFHTAKDAKLLSKTNAWSDGISAFDPIQGNATVLSKPNQQALNMVKAVCQSLQTR